MPSHLTLHIGTPKSGTTYLQAILLAGRERLRRDGILYPGASYLPHRGFNQQPAIYALGQRHIGWVDPDARRNAARHYERMCQEVTGYDGPVLISAESLAFFDPSEISSLLDGLQGDPAEVSVVITARDLARLLPSIWQQNVKNGAVQPFEEYLDSVARLRNHPTAPIWTAFGLPGLVERWADVVGVGQVTLVTAPHRGQGALWKRFATATGLPEGLPEEVGTGTRKDSNLSLNQTQATLLRHLNLRLQDVGYPIGRQQVIRGRLLRAWMSSDTTSGSQITLPDRFRPMITEWADADCAALLEQGVRVVGSLDDLRPGGSSPARPSDQAPSGLDEVARELLLLLEHELSGSGRLATSRPRRLLQSVAGRAITLSRRVRAATSSGSTVATAEPPARIDITDTTSVASRTPG